MTWAVEHRRGSAANLHARTVPEPTRRTVWILEAERPALVLGSTQPDTDVDDAAMLASGVELARRRSGGGAVLVEPGGCLWVDVVLPRDDLLWDDDVGRAFVWLGEVWAAALTGLGLPGEVHRGRLLRNEWSSRVCFAGIGPGEVTAGGRKVVGISQRRTRDAARFQCVVLFDWQPSALLSLLAVSDAERVAGERALVAAAAAVDLPPDSLEAAFLNALPRSGATRPAASPALP